MAITGISALSGQQIIAVGATSARSAATASYTTGGDDLQQAYTTLSTRSGIWDAKGDMHESAFSYDGNNEITAYNGSAFKAGDEFPQSATDAIIVVTGNSANWNDVSSKLDSTAFSTVSGDFITALPADMATTGDIADLAESISETYQPKGSYLTADALDNVSGTWNTVTNKLDTTAFSTVSGNFLTAHQSLPESATWNTVTSKLDTTAFSTVSGSFLTAHQSLPDSANWNSTYTTVNTNSGSWSGRPQEPVSGINIDIFESDGKVVFSGMAGGGSVPEGVMVESGLEYNAVNEISGYSGSAFAQYGAEKQWLQHDDTLLHVANSAQYALGVNVSAVQELMGLNGPKWKEETFAGYWNGLPVYQQLVDMTFSSNSTTTAAIPAEVSLTAVNNGRRWIDVSQSFILYGSVNNSLPITWFLGAGRQGCISLISDSLSYRGVDSSNTGCTAYVCVKYRKA